MVENARRRPGPFSLRVTDDEVNVVTRTATLTTGTDQPASSQFPVCAPASVPALGLRGALLALAALAIAGAAALGATRRRRQDAVRARTV
jgi:hypothetical protein